jgi:hypothetical protein
MRKIDSMDDHNSVFDNIALRDNFFNFLNKAKVFFANLNNFHIQTCFAKTLVNFTYEAVKIIF